MTAYRFGQFELDEDTHELRRDGELVPLQPLPRAVLRYLIRNRDRAVRREDLLRACWPDARVTRVSLDRTIHQLRSALGERPHARNAAIQTLPKGGYRFVAKVVTLARPRAVPGEGRNSHLPSAVIPHRTPFVGRRALLAALRDRLALADAGHGGVLLLPGEPGIGKTRALEEIARIASEAGFECLIGGCPEVAGSPPLWLWSEVLGAALAARSDAELREDLGDTLNDVTALAPDLRGRYPWLLPPQELSPDQERFRSFAGAARLLSWMGRSRPVLLALDDLHRADVPALRLLVFLASALSQARVLIVGAYRDTELTRGSDPHQLLAGRLPREGAAVAPLEGFSRGELAELLLAWAGKTLPEADLAFLHERTGGNPFYVTILADRTPGEPFDLASLSVNLAASCVEAVRQHVVMRSDACRASLEAAAVLGRSFSLPILSAMIDQTPEQALRTIQEAMEARIVEQSPSQPNELSFRHLILQEALYAGIPAGQRPGHHLRAGLAFESLHRDDLGRWADTLAHHFTIAAPLGTAEKALRYTRHAADQAMRRLAFEDAALRYHEARRIAGAYSLALPQGRYELALLEAEAHARTESPAADAAFEVAETIARELADPDLLARAVVSHFRGFQPYEARHVPILEELLRALPASDSALRSQLLGRFATALYYQAPFERRSALAGAAFEMAIRVGDPVAEASAIESRYWALWRPENLSTRLEEARAVERSGRELQNVELSLKGLVLQVAGLVELGDLRAVDVCIAEYEALAKSARRIAHYPNLWRAMQALAAGRIDEAERLASAAHETHELTRQGTIDEMFAAQIAMIRREQGRLQELAGSFDGFAEKYGANSAWRTTLPFALSELGQRDRAALEFDKLAQLGFERMPRDLNWLFAVAELASVAAYLRDGRRARELYELLKPFEDRFISVPPGVASIGSASYYLGLLANTLGDHPRAMSHLEAAIDSNARAGVVSWQAQAHLALARAAVDARGQGVLTDARASAREALALAARFDLPLVRDRAERLLGALAG